jgi:hypothetical protein
MPYTAISDKLLKVRPRRGGGFASFFGGDAAAIETYGPDVFAARIISGRSGNLVALESGADNIYIPGTVTGATTGSIFFDDFSSGNLGKTGNGFSWSAPHNAEVISQALELTYLAGGNMAEVKFSLGSVQRQELWLKFDLFIPSNYNHTAGNNKAFYTLWSNSTGSSAGNDGYGNTASTEMLVGLEFNPRGDGGSALALRVQNSAMDYNASRLTLWPNGIVPADRGQWRRIICQVVLSTIPGVDPGNGDGPFWWPSNGIVRVWKDGALIMDWPTANLYRPGGAPGMNRGYLFGAANGNFAQQTKFIIDNFEVAASNIFGVAA